MMTKILRIYEKDFEECFNGSYSVGTDGLTGGDGSITEIEFNFNGGGIQVFFGEKRLKIKAHGDSELKYFIEAFEWMAEKLKRSIEKNKTGKE